jgi:gliding motility-associated-like protein
MCKRSVLLCLLIWVYTFLNAQPCTFPGQTPVSAILVCGTESFNVTTPTFCGQSDIPVPCPGGFAYQNTNPNFFRMNCFQSGTLGFSIVPDDATADYNWQLFDITNVNPINIFSDASLFVACNWSSEPGETGASIDGTIGIVCNGSGQPLYNKMPDIIEGHTYLLMICNQTGRPGNYALAFTGGTAVITDNLEPHLKFVRSTCNGNQVILRLNKKIKCESVAPDGTDFSISNGIGVTGATPVDCTPLLGTDSLLLSLDQPISPGNYTLTIRNGSDGNTATDVCNRNVPDGEQISFTIVAPQPTPMDSVFQPGCAPSMIELVFQNPIQCNSVAADGSDFQITGPQTVVVSSAIAPCSGGATSARIIRLQLASPIIVGGTYQVRLVMGNDGNTIADECNFSTPANSTVTFSVKDTVSAFFTYRSNSACKLDTLSFFHAGGNQVNSWQWSFGTVYSSTIANPVVIIPGAGQQTVQLTVSNGLCTDTYSQNIILDTELKAQIDGPDIICPGDPVQFSDRSIGMVDNWQWSFGNGNTSSSQSPLVQYFQGTTTERFYTIQLIAGNSASNCNDTIQKKVRVLSSCLIAVPSAFSPNGDGLNDYLYPLNAFKADELEFSVFNRYGQLLFRTKDWTKKWDGKVKGEKQATGVYAWILQYKNRDSGEKVFQKGTVLLVR